MSANVQKQQQLERLKTASPLEITSVLQEMELYDKKSSQEIIDEVYEEFRTGENVKKQVLKPVFLSVVDGLLEATAGGRAARRKGLTASRVVQECEEFRYDQGVGSSTPSDPYMDYKNMRERGAEHSRGEYDRGKFEDKGAMDRYKADRVQGEKMLRDEYTGKTNLYEKQNNPHQNYNDPTHRRQGQTDHIVPLKQIDAEFKHNYALSDGDIKSIANQDANLAVTSAEINQVKKDLTNQGYLEMMDEKGNPVDPNTKENMLRLEKEANRAIERSANQAVWHNVKTNKEVGTKLATDAASQAKDYAAGNLILFILKPLYYEISDIFRNGMKEGVNANRVGEALKIRFGRIKKHVMTNAKAFFGDSILSFVKGFITSLIEGFVQLFVGIFKHVFRVVKEGIMVFVRAAKILFGKDSAHMSAAQKGDAIVKMIGATAISLAGIGIDMLLDRVAPFIPTTLRVVLSTLITGVASALFMYVLDRIDLFSVRAEQRRDRILEIFDERIKDIREAEQAFNVTAIETLRKQREAFEGISEHIKDGMQKDDIEQINSGLYQMAHFMGVELSYQNTEEFCDYMDSEAAICL